MSEETRPKTVIVAEDGDGEREALEQFLVDHGYVVQAVANPAAITGLGDCLAVLMDVKFGANRFLGLEYVIEKRQSGELPPRTLVIFMSHWRTPVDDLKRAGRHEFLSKGLEYTQIRKLLDAEARA